MMEYNKFFKKLVEYLTFKNMSSEFWCDIVAKLNGISKVSTSETEGSKTCLVDVFTKSKLNACTGVCLKCKSRITLGKFNNESSKSLTPNSKDDDTWYL